MTRIHSRALLVLVFSLHLLNETGYNICEKPFFLVHRGSSTVSVTCGFPTVPKVSLKANDKKLAFLPTPGEEGHNKK